MLVRINVKHPKTVCCHEDTATMAAPEYQPHRLLLGPQLQHLRPLCLTSYQQLVACVLILLGAAMQQNGTGRRTCHDALISLMLNAGLLSSNTISHLKLTRPQQTTGHSSCLSIGDGA